MKYVYFFGRGHADGGREMKDLLGGKGANLAEMTGLGVPVPPGFTLTTEACRHYLISDELPEGARSEVDGALARLEKTTGKQFGGSTDPLPQPAGEWLLGHRRGDGHQRAAAQPARAR